MGSYVGILSFSPSVPKLTVVPVRVYQCLRGARNSLKRPEVLPQALGIMNYKSHFAGRMSEGEVRTRFLFLFTDLFILLFLF